MNEVCSGYIRYFHHFNHSHYRLYALLHGKKRPLWGKRGNKNSTAKKGKSQLRRPLHLKLRLKLSWQLCESTTHRVKKGWNHLSNGLAFPASLSRRPSVFIQFWPFSRSGRSVIMNSSQIPFPRCLEQPKCLISVMRSEDCGSVSPCIASGRRYPAFFWPFLSTPRASKERGERPPRRPWRKEKREHCCAFFRGKKRIGVVTIGI